MAKQKSRTIGRSFRINEQYFNTLNEEAERAGISSNALINKILQDYCEYHRYFKRFGAISISQKEFSRIVEACPKEALLDIAKKAGSVVAPDIFRSRGLRFDNEDSTFYVTTILAEYANWFRCEHYFVNDKEYFHLRHDLGEKWSIYIGEALSVLFESCCKKRVKKEFLDGAVTLEIPLSQYSTSDRQSHVWNKANISQSKNSKRLNLTVFP